MKELQITKIYEENNLVGYGANQDWFNSEWAKKAGCGSVLGSILYAFYTGIQKSSKEEFIKIMEDLYTYMTPGKMGFPYFYKFAHQFVLRMEKENIQLKPIYLKRSKSIESSIQFVKKSIDTNQDRCSICIIFCSEVLFRGCNQPSAVSASAVSSVSSVSSSSSSGRRKPSL